MDAQGNKNNRDSSNHKGRRKQGSKIILVDGKGKEKETPSPCT